MTDPKRLMDDAARGMALPLRASDPHRVSDAHGLSDHATNTASGSTHSMPAPAPRLLITMWWAVAAVVSIAMWTTGYWALSRHAAHKAKVSRVAHPAATASTASAPQSVPNASSVSPNR